MVAKNATSWVAVIVIVLLLVFAKAIFDVGFSNEKVKRECLREGNFCIKQPIPSKRRGCIPPKDRLAHEKPYSVSPS